MAAHLGTQRAEATPAPHRFGTPRLNVETRERWASAIGGAFLAAYGLRRRSLGGMFLALTGGLLAYRGITGHCDAYEAIGVSTARRRKERPDMPALTRGRGVHVERTVTINRSAPDLYRYWRELENLPRFMDHLESVQVVTATRSHWMAKAPRGRRVEWDAEIVGDKENELIAWRSVGDAGVDNGGSVRFQAAPGGRGTEVKVVVAYHPPGGKLGSIVAKLFGEDPDQQVREDLRRFKQIMETGESPTTSGQPRARS